MTTQLLQSRQRIESKIEELISLLDLLDDDADLEPDNDNEPSLGWPAGGLAALAKNVEHDDRELEDASGYGDAAGMVADEMGEPSLGWTNHIDQDAPDRLGSSVFSCDVELDDCDDEPNGDETDTNFSEDLI